MKLSLETRYSGVVVIIHCVGRIVYREEAAALSRVIAQVLQQAEEVILDFEGVQDMDSAGLGELVRAHTTAVNQGKTVRVAGANARVSELLDLTNLASLFEPHSSVDDAVEAEGEMAGQA